MEGIERVDFSDQMDDGRIIAPELETEVNVYRLAAARGKDHTSLAVQHNFNCQIKQARLFGCFNEDHRTSGVFKVDINYVAQGEGTNREALLPSPGTGCKIWTSNGTFFKGMFCAELFNQDLSVCAYVKQVGRCHDAFFPADSKKPTKLFISDIHVNIDTQVSQREVAAMTEVAHSPDRAPGDGVYPDIKYFWLNAPRTVEKMNGWYDTMVTGEQEAFLEAASNYGLNEEQMLVFEDFASSEHGCTTVVGPPGTGKSHVAETLIKVLMDHNRKWRPDQRCPIVLAGPSDESVDLILRELQHFLRANFNAVRFLGANSAQKHTNLFGAKNGGADMETGELEQEENVDLVELDRAFWWLIERSREHLRTNEPLRDFEYHLKFVNFLERVRHNRTYRYKFRKKAQSYKQGRCILRNKNATHQQIKVAIEMVEDAKEELLQEFWGEVDILFVTLDNAAHDDLRRCYKARTIIIDQSATTSLPALMTCLPSFRDTMWNIVLAGDSRRLSDRASPGINKVAGWISESPLTRIQEDPSCPLQYVFLKQQYRMNPEISAFSNKMVYDGELIDHPSVFTVSEDEVTVKKFFSSRFGGAYAGKNIVGIDISGANTHSRLFSDGASQFNSAEADALRRLLKGLLDMDAPQGGRKLQPSDFLLITPYSGQETHLHIILRKEGLLSGVQHQDSKNLAKLKTSCACHGTEANIVIVSWCVNRENEPTDCGFISHKQSINRVLSRPKHFMIHLGNFGPWMQGLVNGQRVWQDKQPLESLAKFLNLMRNPGNNKIPYKIIARDDFEAGMSGRKVSRSAFADQVRIRKRKNM